MLFLLQFYTMVTSLSHAYQSGFFSLSFCFLALSAYFHILLEAHIALSIAKSSLFKDVYNNVRSLGQDQNKIMFESVWRVCQYNVMNTNQFCTITIDTPP